MEVIWTGCEDDEAGELGDEVASPSQKSAQDRRGTRRSRKEMHRHQRQVERQ